MDRGRISLMCNKLKTQKDKKKMGYMTQINNSFKIVNMHLK